jgi:hypothetical protein
MPITRRRRANPPDQPENNNHLVDPTEQAAASLAAEQASVEGDYRVPPPQEHMDNVTPPPPSAPSMTNGDRLERQEYPPAPSIEGGRRTPRGELFRRPPQPPTPPPAAFTPSSSVQAPTHEIALPLGNLLHLAYNPGYTGSDEARALLLHRLSDETKAGGRARCWNCGSIAIAYDRWNTRSKTFGEVGIAFCEVCGVWSVM